VKSVQTKIPGLGGGGKGQSVERRGGVTKVDKKSEKTKKSQIGDNPGRRRDGQREKGKGCLTGQLFYRGGRGGSGGDG